jgi:hypothetical protein
MSILSLFQDEEKKKYNHMVHSSLAKAQNQQWEERQSERKEKLH